MEVVPLRRQVQPIICPTQYHVNDCFIKREIPVIHPTVIVNRQNIVNVPQHYFPQSVENIVSDPGRMHGTHGSHGMNCHSCQSPTPYGSHFNNFFGPR